MLVYCSSLNTLVLWVITLPKHTGGAPHGLLALLLGAGDCAGDSRGLDAIVESVGVGDWEICWLTCGSIEVSVSKNILSDMDVRSDSSSK